MIRSDVAPGIARVEATTVQVPAVSFRAACAVWAKIGLLSFGGPAGQVALMHKELVERRKWIDDERFLHALNYCMLLPGPEAQQLATYIGWLMHRTAGGLVAGGLFVLPGFIAILMLSALYAGYAQLPIIATIFFGLKAAVLAIVVEAVIRIGKRALKRRWMYGIAALAFVALFFFAVPFPWVVFSAGLGGFVGSRVVPQAFAAPAASAHTAIDDTVIGAMHARGELSHTRPAFARALRVTLLCVTLWVAPLIALSAMFGSRSVFVEEGLFFSKTALVTFGGAYAVLAYVAQRAVETFGWLHPGEMVDGLGLAETTPGPLIMVVQFVGFLGAYRHSADLSPMLAGVLGSCITVWVTFVPCFFWIFLGAPYIEALRGHRPLNAALSSITAAVVGVILNLSIWFFAHTLFHQVAQTSFGPMRLLSPQWSSFDPRAALLALLAMFAIFRLHLGVPKTLGLCTAAGVVLQWVG